MAVLASRKTKKATPGLLVENRRARFEYHFVEEYEAGIALLGSEVKSIRDRKISLAEAFCQFFGDELYLVQAHVSEYTNAHARNHEPLRKRKLLLKRKELDSIRDAVKLQGVTVVPTKVYLKDRQIKLGLALGKGKKLHDKRATIREREQKREMDRARRREYTS